MLSGIRLKIIQENKVMGGIWNDNIRVLITVKAGDWYMELYHSVCFCIYLKCSRVKYKHNKKHQEQLKQIAYSCAFRVSIPTFLKTKTKGDREFFHI